MTAHHRQAALRDGRHDVTARGRPGGDIGGGTAAASLCQDDAPPVMKMSEKKSMLPLYVDIFWEPADHKIPPSSRAGVGHHTGAIVDGPARKSQST
jgi:hypothetical protein